MAKDRLSHLATNYRITNNRFRIKDVDPGDTRAYRRNAGDLLKSGIERLAELQERMYAQDRWALLLVFQALDAAGKDGTIKHVMSGINPQGCVVSSFKRPTPEDLDHDFLWRCMKHLPERGRIGIFNRSYYEEVLVVRVQFQLLAAQRCRRSRTRTSGKPIQTAASRMLTDQGTVIRKFFLHVSKKEQRKRFFERLDQPEKNWKFSTADVHEREHFDDYMDSYEDLIRHTSTKNSPWYVVPADNKWFTRLVVASVVTDALESIKPSFPKLDGDKLNELNVARAALEAEPGQKKTRKKEEDAGAASAEPVENNHPVSSLI
jgi:PPK2 family polyphosphate:nucleotide phosphotransferase